MVSIISAGQRLKAYDIHYIHGGVKKAMRHVAPSMTDALAWRLAIVDTGVPLSVLPLDESLSEIVSAGRILKVAQVRWNLSQKAVSEQSENL